MTQNIRVHRWESTHAEELTEEAIRADHPSEKYRVSMRRFAPKTKAAGGMRRATCYVLSGSGRYTFASEVTLEAGDVAELPEGPFTFEVTSDTDFVAVLCWELPFEFNRVQ